MFKKILKWGALTILGLFIIIQLIPYGRAHSNPPVRMEPQWDSPQTRELAKRACFDCHSNETVWPWYSNVAPVSWLVQRDVEKARQQLNFSEWDRPENEAGEAAEQIKKGEMPLWFYVPLHPSARLSAGEKQALIRGLQATIGDHEEENGEIEESDEHE
ncbi:MAG: heme-binding domain-containing protein [candidate division KSB1 bacterium]|nr:heme-binding domain-containing protein [candidate division KSB1 bacterium]MDZ7366710.1 heme-binding domain-containing protein [candidate division KSB1 bacterium]MDZ7404723.1 heme-binding domain-containing protein [candidate division KSB1 bacterium]